MVVIILNLFVCFRTLPSDRNKGLELSGCNGSHNWVAIRKFVKGWSKTLLWDFFS